MGHRARNPKCNVAGEYPLASAPLIITGWTLSQTWCSHGNQQPPGWPTLSTVPRAENHGAQWYPGPARHHPLSCEAVESLRGEREPLIQALLALAWLPGEAEE